MLSETLGKEIIAAISIAIFAAIFNIIFLAGAVLKDKPGSNGLGTVLEGNCKRLDWWNKIAHGFINVTSSASVHSTR